MRVSPIGVLHSDFVEKFGAPRQAGLAPSARGTLRLTDEWVDAVDGLAGFSHVWLLWWFDRARGARAKVRPPRLGGQKKVGVFASRSPFRPNPIGLSAVALLEVRVEERHVDLVFGGVDLVDGTPILDIKPYLPYADALPGATAGWAPGPPEPRSVRFTAAADVAVGERPGLRALIEETVGQDPRPAWRPAEGDPRTYGVRLRDVDVRWRVDAVGVEVVDVVEGADHRGT